MLIVAIIGIICLIINFVCVVDFKWHIDYFISKDGVCEKLRWTALEIESMRYNFATFLKDPNGKFASIRKDYVNTYSIVTTVLGLLLLLAVFMIAVALLGVDLSQSDNLQPYYWIIFATVPMLIIFIAVTSRYLKNFDDIKNDKELTAYYNVYKIVSAVMISSGMKNVELKYSFEGLGKDTLDNILEKNIASYEDVHVSSKVKEIKQEAYKKLDFLKYLVFDKYSPYYLPYFDNIYIREKLAEGKFLEDLYLNYEKTIKSPINSQWFRSDIGGQIDLAKQRRKDYLNSIYSFPLEMYQNSDANIIYDKALETMEQKPGDRFSYYVNGIETVNENTYPTIKNNIEYKKKIENIEKKYIDELKGYLKGGSTMDEIYTDYTNIKNLLEKMASENSVDIKQSHIYTYANDRLDKSDMKNTYIPYIKANMNIHSLLTNAGATLDIPDNDYIKYYVEHKDILTSEPKSDKKMFKDIFKRVKEQSDYAYMYYIYLSLIFLLVSHYIFNITDRSTYIYILAVILLTYILFIWVYTQLSFLG
jgi:hypothetical protein